MPATSPGSFLPGRRCALRLVAYRVAGGQPRRSVWPPGGEVHGGRGGTERGDEHRVRRPSACRSASPLRCSAASMSSPGGPGDSGGEVGEKQDAGGGGVAVLVSACCGGGQVRPAAVRAAAPRDIPAGGGFTRFRVADESNSHWPGRVDGVWISVVVLPGADLRRLVPPGSAAPGRRAAAGVLGPAGDLGVPLDVRDQRRTRSM